MSMSTKPWLPCRQIVPKLIMLIWREYHTLVTMVPNYMVPKRQQHIITLRRAIRFSYHISAVPSNIYHVSYKYCLIVMVPYSLLIAKTNATTHNATKISCHRWRWEHEAFCTALNCVWLGLNTGWAQGRGVGVVVEYWYQWICWYWQCPAGPQYNVVAQDG